MCSSTPTKAGRDGSIATMAATAIHRSPHVTIHLDDPDPPAAHRLPELLQVLTGCSVGDAELAVGDPLPEGPVTSDDALTTLATAIVRLRRAASAAEAYEEPTLEEPAPPAPAPDRTSS